MSLENAKRFIEAASQDHALQEKLAAAQEPGEALRLAVEAASERGLPFTAEELVAGIRENIPTANAGELNDSELNQVSGGLDPVTWGMLLGAYALGSGALIGGTYSKEIKAAGSAVTKSIDVGKLIP